MIALSRLREPVNGLTHLLGFVLAIAGHTVLVTLAAQHATSRHVVAFAVYGATLMGLYLASSLYHLLPLTEVGVRRLKRLDHIMVFMLIAGTYTPICLLALGGAWGWSLFGVVWGLAVAGTAFKLCWLGAPRRLVTGIYIAMGWVVLVAIVPLVGALPPGGLLWLALGGLCYTGGAVIYARRRPDPWPGRFGFHEIWHLFVLAGSACHFWMMLGYVLPLG
ncbi:MAG: hemolysin III family protein [Myxococcota bacterium]|jgi:hemolysin III|nr:hemolysin III family protein [Myxococcota bacterium]